MCVRIDSYESKQHQEWVRNFLRGRFANTAFCILSPDGQDRLTRSGRSPGSVFGDGNEASIEDMAAIAKRYPARFDQSQAIMQDFHSIGQALNVASADQRMLVLVVGPKDKTDAARKTLKPVINEGKHLGRFHVDFETGKQWTKRITGAKANEGILFVKADEFGLKGRVLQRLPLDASESAIHAKLTEANRVFMATTAKKEYQAHVRKGHRLGIKHESTIPYGEDRDGDGEIDQKGRRRSRR